MSLDPKNPVYKCDNCEWYGTREKLLDIGKVSYCPACEKPLIGQRPKMLFVDDRTKRLHYALNNFPDYDVTIATCVPEALRALSSQDWDVVSLDHDLNGYDFQDPDTPTCGMEIVRYIEKCGGWPTKFEPPDVWIHSSNLFAVHLMMTRLDRMGFNVQYKTITYPVENMKYDKEGLPK